MGEARDILPCNLEAERIVLGSVLLDDTVYPQVSDALAMGDFSLQSHATMYRRMGDLHGRGEPIDRLTLHNELLKFNELESVGGLGYIVSLDDGLPHLPKIDSYVRIVKDKAMLRQIIFASQGAIARAQIGEDDPSEILAGAQDVLRKLADGATQSSQQPISTKEMIDRDGVDVLLAPRQHGEVRLPWKRLDRALSGLSAGQMLVLLGETSRGKTSFALQAAAHIIQQQKAALIWTMEMSPRSLFRRLITQLSGVAPRTGQGQMTFDDRDRHRIAVAALGENPIYFDRHSRSVASFCASVRRVQSLAKLGLVVVDYLQLIRSSSSSRDSRAQQVSENSRNLKLALMDFGVPGIVLSQVDRSSVKNGGKIGLHSGKECVTGETVVMSAAGIPIRVKELQAGTEILAMGASQKIVPCVVEKVWATGIKATWNLVTQTGRRITATANHPFFTARGWRPLGRLTPGDVIATAIKLRCHNSAAADPGLCRLMGYLAGDGSYLAWRHQVSFISNDAETFADVDAIVRQHWPTLKRNQIKHPEGYFECHFTIGESDKGRHLNPMKRWLESVGCLGERDSTKRVPAFVFESGEEGAREFLAGYLATDGCVKFSKQQPRAEVHFDSTSPGLLEDVQILLSRLGIVSVLNDGEWHTKSTKPIYRLALSIIDANIREFATAVPVRGKKRGKLELILARRPKAETSPGLFALPIEVSEFMWERSGGRASGGGWTHQGKRPRRSSAARWAAKYGDAEIAAWAESDLLWESVKSIEPSGEREVFDLSLPSSGNFLANGIVVHNSGDVENDADILLWIEAPELSRESPTPVSVVVGKQREGPAGFPVPMVFIPTSQTFVEAVDDDD